MYFREATIDDIDGLSLVRLAVTENVLSNPRLITKQDYADYLTINGKGWLCEIENQIVGFAIVGLLQKNVWALFIRPNFEKKGIGKQLHDFMMRWYFLQTDATIWLSTEKNTKAEKFYKKQGWTAVGMYNEYEVKFEMSFINWKKLKNPS